MHAHNMRDCAATLVTKSVYLSSVLTQLLHDRVSYYANYVISRHRKETLYIAQIQHILQAVSGNTHVLRLAVCELYGANTAFQACGQLRSS